MINYKFSFFLKPSRTEKNKSFINIFYSINGIRKRESTGHGIHNNSWDKKNECVKITHPDYDTINKDLQARKQNILKPILDAQFKGKETVVLSKAYEADIFLFVEQFISEVKGKRARSTITNYEKHLRKLKDFAGDQLTFEQIDHNFLLNYETFINSTGKENSTYSQAVWRTLRTWFNAARKREITTNYPFNTYENPNNKPYEKDFLTLGELIKFESVLEGKYKLPGLYFLLGCYCGLRVSDLYKYTRKDNVKGNQFIIQATKNEKWVSMPISKPLARIIKQIGDQRLDEWEQTVNEYLREICKKAGIEKHLSWHSARKSFAVTVCGNTDMRESTIAKLMGVTMDTLVKSYFTVTDIHIQRETERAWRKLK